MSPVSLSSSFSSSLASSMLLPASASAPHSDSTITDQLAPAPSHTFDKSRSGELASSHNFRSSSPSSSMGQVVSRPQVNTTLPPSSSPSYLGNAASATGSRFKRAFAGRRKKSDVIGPSPVSSPIIGKNKEPASSNSSVYRSLDNTTARQAGAKQLTLQFASHVFSKRQSGSAPASPVILPPPLPPKHGVPQPPPRAVPLDTSIEKRITVLTTTSPSIAPTLEYIRQTDGFTETESATKDTEKSEHKDVRRKSDSTLSHHTVRPGLGSATPRPVSMTESFQSNSTIVPVNKRLSALITDAEYATPEEVGEPTEENHGLFSKSTSPGRRVSPASSLMVRDRRSQSLNLGPPLALMASVPTVAQASVSLDAIHHNAPSPISEESDRALRNALLLSNVARSMGPASSGDSSTHRQPRPERTLPDLPQPPRSPLALPASPIQPSFRQTAISMTSGFAPAAGLARRAVERMGRVWGSKSSSPSPHPVSPVTSSSSFPINFMYRASSGHSGLATRKKHGHTPHTPSVSSTASSLSDHEGPQLGRCMRGPISKLPTGAGGGGLVFGRDLMACVKDTAVDASGRTYSASEDNDHSDNTSPQIVPLASLGRRHLPALVVRCTQHILTWGVQEQGLFRVSGRSSHVAKLRAEFDTGADFDIVQSSPGDLDPHAVASIFKAYLRELPEPILTHRLMPFFDVVMASERSMNHVPEVVPSSDNACIRKPPSLSTLAMPNFTGVPPSDSLCKALSSLIARLPQENRDLLLTVTEVINFTAERSQETKMPLSNLLLVLCPSLNMNPALLQALCESQDIWKRVENSHETSPSDLQDIDSMVVPDDDSRPSNGDKYFVQPLSWVVDDTEPPPVTTVAATSAVVWGASESRTACDLSSRVPSGESSPLKVDDDLAASLRSQGFPTTLTDPFRPPSLSSSAESLSVPSLSSTSPTQSTKNLPFSDLDTPQSSTSAHSPIIAEPIVVSFSQSKIPSQSQFQFPSVGENLRSPLSHKKSFSSSISGDISSGSLASRTRRLKKPSLHLLFSKRSGSPMLTTPNSQSPCLGNTKLLSGQHQPISRSSSTSESSPESMVTAPQSSRFSFPPVLNTAIDESSISLALGIHDEEAHAVEDDPIESWSSSSEVADIHCRKSPRLTTEKKGYCPHLDISVADGSDHDGTWMQSVLLAAGETTW
ncbi:hypothetical protein V8B97DRAFT_1276653 [Scleroderma yunnanense]